jgi:twitching motility protein PilJ
MFDKLNNLKIWQKLALISSLLALPIVVLILLFVSARDRQIAHTQREIEGLDYVAALRPLLENLPLHRDAALAVAYGDENSRPRLNTISQTLKNALANANDVNARLGAQLGVAADYANYSKAWSDATASPLPAAEVFAKHNAAFTQLTGLIRAAGEKSGLRTDQEVAYFYLADTILAQIPDLAGHISQLRAYATSVASQGKVSPQDAARTLYYANLVDAANSNVRRNLAASLQEESATQEGQPNNSTNARSTLRQATANAIASADKFRSVAEKEIGSGSENVSVSASSLATLGNAASEDYFTLLDASLERMKSQLTRRAGDLRDEKYAQIAGGFLVLLLTGVVAFSVNVGITRQLRSILNTFNAIKKGDYEARAESYYRDELGATASSLNATLDQTLVLIQSREERDRIQGSIMKLLEEVSGVAEGDLRNEAEVTSDVTGAIADSFNYMIAELRSLIGAVQSTTLSVDASARQMQSSAESLAEGSTRQSEQIAEASRTIERINDSIRQVASAAATAAGVAETALSNAQGGAHSVQRTIEGMNSIRGQVQETSKRVKRLGESSQEIGEIVLLIGDIADRTSILALNASIQAAAAGEAGRGFAVVAEEVERLAERAAESAKRIGSLIRSVQTDTHEAIAAMEKTTQEVVGGSQLANDAGGKLGQIESVSRDISRLVTEILEATRRQSESSESVTRKVAGVAEFTSRTAQDAEKVETNVHQLAQLARQLNESMSRFKLPETEKELSLV